MSDEARVFVKSRDKDGNPEVIRYENESALFAADIKYGGCIDIYMYYGGKFGDSTDKDNIDEMHFCELDDFMNMLKDIKTSAQILFNSREAWKK